MAEPPLSARVQDFLSSVSAMYEDMKQLCTVGSPADNAAQALLDQKSRKFSRIVSNFAAYTTPLHECYNEKIANRMVEAEVETIVRNLQGFLSRFDVSYLDILPTKIEDADLKGELESLLTCLDKCRQKAKELVELLAPPKLRFVDKWEVQRKLLSDAYCKYEESVKQVTQRLGSEFKWPIPENLNNLKDPVPLKIAVLGLMKCGKSSLVNRLLGVQVCPEDTVTCTGRITRIYSGDKTQLSVKLNGAVCWAGSYDPKSPIFSATWEKFTEEVKKVVRLPTDNTDIDLAKALVEVNLPVSPLTDGVEIWDVPGLDENPNIDDIRIRVLHSVDAVLYLVDASTEFSETNKRMARQINTHYNLGAMESSVVMLVVTKIDVVEIGELAMQGQTNARGKAKHLFDQFTSVCNIGASSENNARFHAVCTSNPKYSHTVNGLIEAFNLFMENAARAKIMQRALRLRQAIEELQLLFSNNHKYHFQKIEALKKKSPEVWTKLAEIVSDTMNKQREAVLDFLRENKERILDACTPKNDATLDGFTYGIFTSKSKDMQEMYNLELFTRMEEALAQGMLEGLHAEVEQRAKARLNKELAAFAYNTEFQLAMESPAAFLNPDWPVSLLIANGLHKVALGLAVLGGLLAALAALAVGALGGSDGAVVGTAMVGSILTLPLTLPSTILTLIVSGLGNIPSAVVFDAENPRAWLASRFDDVAAKVGDALRERELETLNSKKKIFEESLNREESAVSQRKQHAEKLKSITSPPATLLGNLWIDVECVITLVQQNNVRVEENAGAQLGPGVRRGRLHMGTMTVSVALKRLSKSDIDSARNEVSCLRTLRHRNIVEYHGCWRASDDQFDLVLELMTCTLHQRLEKQPALTTEAKHLMTSQLVAAVRYIHFRNIMHRDIHGSNVLLDEHGNVKLCDFGISKDLSQVSGLRIRGHLSCIAPECLLPADNGPLPVYGLPADIYAMGIVLWEIWAQCVYKLPNTTGYVDDPAALRDLVVNKRVRPNWSSLPQHPNVAPLIQKCVAPDPAHRYTAAQLADELKISPYEQ